MAKVVKKVVKVVWIAVQVVVGAITLALGTITGQPWMVMLGSALLANGLRQFANLFFSRPSLNNSIFERLQKQVNPTAPRRIVFGKTAGGADVRYFEKYASDDKYAEVIAVASHKVHAFKALYFEDTLTWNGSTTTGKYAGGIISITARTEGSAANAFSMGSGSYWTTSCRMTGLAYLGIAYKLSAKKWPDGVPSKIMIEVEGCPVYDPRLDSTNGGSGAHRPDTQTTWAYYNGGTAIGRNPALCLLAYLIGWRINGRLAWGMGVPVSRIDLANFIAYANICEESVTLLAGGTVQRYTCDLMVSTSDTHEAVITAITACMGSCQLTDTDGQYQLVGGYDDTAGPKIAYSADDMMGAYEWQPSPPSRERINIVRGRYCNPTKLYQLEDWPAVEVTGLYDGIPRVRTVELIGVTRAETAQRIAKQMLLRDQYPGRLSCAVGPRGFLVKVGSLVTLSLPTEGWNSKLFRVIDQTESHDLLFSMTLQEEAPEIYAWDEEEKPLPDDITPPGYDPADTRTPAALTATARTVAGGGGTVVPYIDVSWTAETSELVAGIEIQAKEASGSIWVPVTEGLFDASVGAFSTTANAPETEIDIRARYRMMSGVYGAWVEASVTSAAAPVPVGNVDGLGDLATRNAAGQLLPDSTFDPSWWAYSAGMTRVTGASISASFPATYGLKIVPGGAGEAFCERAGVGPTAVAVIPCQPGQLIHGGGHITYNGAPEDGSIGFSIRAYTAAGVYISTIASGFFGKSPGARFEKISGTTPANAAYALLVIVRQSSMTTGEWYVGSPHLGSAESGATQGAPAGTTVGGVPAEDVEGSIANLSPATGRALSNFITSSGLPFSKIAAVGEARDGDAVTFPATFDSVPKITFLPGGNAATAGQNIVIQATGLSASGFTMKAKSQSVTAGSTITDTGATAGGAGEPDLVINRTNSGAPFDGKFTFSVSVYVGAVAPGEPGYIWLSLAVKKSGAWVGVGAIGFSQTGTYSAVVTPGTVDFGAGAEFGVDVVFTEGSSGLSAFNSVKYTLGTVTETSLTPTGASSIPWIALVD